MRSALEENATSRRLTNLGLIAGEFAVPEVKTFKSDGELDIARPDNVLNLELSKLSIEAELLDNTGVFARGEAGVVLRFGAGNDHLARRKDKRGRLGVANAHDDGSKALMVDAR